MQHFKQHINRQIERNAGKNIFAGRDGLFRFIELPDSLVQDLRFMSKNEESRLIDHIINRSLAEFYRLNQFYYFSNRDKKMLRSIYVSLLQNIKTDDDLSVYEETHYDKLSKWLAETNPFAPKLYNAKKETLQKVVCEEYNALLQLDLLHIDLNNIKQPVLDIGCGKNGELVDFLRKSGIEAFGFDRCITNTEFCKDADWFDYHYGNEKWGTIISNLGFSNHFNHHHLRSDGNYVAYAQTYMQILHSLKSGGTFHYAPGLPFIEKFLDKEKYDTYTYNVFNSDYKATVVKRNSHKTPN